MPRHALSTSTTSAGTSRLVRNHDRTVLLVDDHLAMRQVVHEMLDRLGYRVLTARNASEALAIADAYWDPIDLYILDVVMPGMTGLEAAQELRRIHPEAKLMYLSGHASACDSMLSRGEPFLLKPCSEERLEAALEAVLWMNDGLVVNPRPDHA